MYGAQAVSWLRGSINPRFEFKTVQTASHIALGHLVIKIPISSYKINRAVNQIYQMIKQSTFNQSVVAKIEFFLTQIHCRGLIANSIPGEG